jgi:integrase
MSKPPTLHVEALRRQQATAAAPVPAIKPAPMPLDPMAYLAALAIFEADLRAGARAPATVLALCSDWAVYMRWCEEHGHLALPATLPVACDFFRHQGVTLGKKLSTLRRYRNSLRLIHDRAHAPHPFADAEFHDKFRAIVNTMHTQIGADGQRRSAKPRQAEPARHEVVQAMLARLGDSPRDLRDAAMIALASDALLRESELVAVRVGDIRPSTDGAWAVDLPFSKTDQLGLGQTRYCSADAQARVARWCEVAGITKGYIFLPIGGRPRLKAAADPQPLRPREVINIFRRHAQRAGIPNAQRITGHSMRVGTPNDLAEHGFSIGDIQLAGGWSDPKTVMRYIAQTTAGRNAVAKLRKAQREG